MCSGEGIYKLAIMGTQKSSRELTWDLDLEEDELSSGWAGKERLIGSVEARWSQLSNGRGNWLLEVIR